jgi:hypothetical protein
MTGGRTPSTGGAGARDRGVSFIEVLVSIVLLGTAVVFILVAVRVSVIGTRLERDHSKAHQWLQSAVGVIEDEPFGDCVTVSTDKAVIILQYQTSIDSQAGRPDGFDGTIEITDLDVWNGQGWVDFGSQPVCLDDKLLRQQRVTVEARTSSGDIIEILEVVKRDTV